MKSRDYEIAKKLKNKLSDVVHLVDFRVFGSRAKGNDTEYSDIDVFIEVETIDKEIKQIIRDIVWELGFEHSIYISPIIFTRFEIEETPLRSSPLVENIFQEGVHV
jgi:predicted nucleotidyltransferase